jgi:hypothetical protein
VFDNDLEEAAKTIVMMRRSSDAYDQSSRQSQTRISTEEFKNKLIEEGMDSLTHSLTGLLTRLLTCLLTCLLTYLLTGLLTHSYLLTYSLTYLLTHSPRACDEWRGIQGCGYYSERSKNK